MTVKDFDMTSVAELPGFESAMTKDVAGDPTPEQIQNVAFRRSPGKREFFDSLRVANATDHIRQLPAVGQTLHCITRGNYSMFDIVPTTIALIAPATIAELRIATLGFSVKNANDLFGMMDAGKIHAAKIVCSCYFRSTSATIFEHMTAGLKSRGQQIVAMRNHAKIIMMRTTDGQHITIEGSANLRSCRNIEQFAMTNDQALYEFHTAWMDVVLAAGDTK
jgi:hypothetical protein